ncbi:sensor histidine kinase [Ruminococcaceae bacterium OttesenSCG-928-D13]|nr:sensor histidine kinase [Ruminococcaceae bacterium OttesenSCG-928-D13]
MEPDKIGAEPKSGGRVSLKWSLVLLILICWVLPLTVTVAVSGYQSVRSTRERVADIVTASVENTMGLAVRDLNTAVNEALSVSYVPTVRQAYMNYQSTGNKVSLMTTTRTFLGQKYYRSQMVRAAYVVYPELAVDDTILAYNQDAYSWSEAARFYETGLYDEISALMGELDTGIAFRYENGRLYLARLLSLQERSFSPYAALVEDIDLTQLFDGVHRLPYVTFASVTVGGCEILIEDEGQAAGADPVAKSGRSSDIEVMEGVLPGERFELSYRLTADLRPLTEQMSNPLGVLLWIALFSLGLMMVVVTFFMRRISRPINILSRFAGQIERGDFGAQTDIEKLGNTEFVTLGQRMNAMSARLEHQFEHIYREELALRDARIKALQSQINPHFLGNTLETINWEARLAGNEKVSRMLEALSTMMGATLDRSHRPLVHLSEELAYVNAYLLIIGERLGKRLSVVKEIDESLLDWMVPRLVLQPIVENAIEHGVSGRQSGRIVIRVIRRAGDWMSLEVENDGLMPPENERRVRELLESETEPEGVNSYNIGIRNVHQRLRLLYGPGGGLSVTNTKNGTTLSAMCIQEHQIHQIESS